MPEAMRALVVDEDRCIGCGLCAVVCSLAHSALGLNAQDGRTVSLPRARLRVSLRSDGHPPFAGGSYRLFICRHCEDPVCVTGCVSRAIFVDEATGVVDIDRERCVGCWTCVLECPFGAVELGLATEHRAFKCDGCRHLDAPQCARFCPTGALTGGTQVGRETAGRRRAHAVRRGAAGRAR